MLKERFVVRMVGIGLLVGVIFYILNLLVGGNFTFWSFSQPIPQYIILRLPFAIMKMLTYAAISSLGFGVVGNIIIKRRGLKI